MCLYCVPIHNYVYYNYALCLRYVRLIIIFILLLWWKLIQFHQMNGPTYICWFILSNHDLSKTVLTGFGSVQLVGITTGHYMSAQDKQWQHISLSQFTPHAVTTSPVYGSWEICDSFLVRWNKRDVILHDHVQKNLELVYLCEKVILSEYCNNYPRSPLNIMVN